jgi:hypothetical protein
MITDVKDATQKKLQRDVRPMFQVSDFSDFQIKRYVGQTQKVQQWN